MLNSVNFVGRIATDLRKAPSGKVADFILAVDRNRKNPETGERDTDFFTIKVFNGAIEAIEAYTTVGDLISFSGSAEQQTWETKEGEKRSRVAFPGQVTFLPQGRRNGQPGEDRATELATPRTSPVKAEASPGDVDFREVDFADADDEDDIPF